MTDSQKWLVFAFISVSIWLLYLLASILMPFAFAAMLAYLGDPLTDKLEAYRLSRTKAVLVVFSVMSLILVLVLLLLVPLLEYQVERFLSNLPVYVAWLNETVIPWVQRRFHLGIRPVNLKQVINLVKSHWEQAGGIAATIMSSVSHSGGVLAEWVMNLLLIPVVTFYLLRDWDSLIVKIHDLLPRRIAPTASKLAGEVDTVLSAFVRGQFYVMLALGCIYSIGLWMTGLDLALLIGMLAGLVSFVPYLGAIVGIVMACIAALAQFHELVQLVPVVIVFTIGQSLEGMLLTPMLVGDKIGLHPVAVMFAVLAGGQLFGFLGILLALPIASIIMVLIRHMHDLYRDSDFYVRQ
ncbi:MAG: AI-2E family transporter [Methylobacter sp.]|nr:AI-2E family transporter [Methylobacter sp.]